MCLKKLGWDDEAPDELETCFIKWKINLLNCKALEIPGWYRVNNKGDIEVYIFSDAYICMWCCSHFKCKTVDDITDLESFNLNHF